MAPSGQRIRHSAEQRLARQFVERASLPRRDSAAPSLVSPAASAIFTAADAATFVPSSATFPAGPSPSNSGPPGVTLPPHGAAALVGIIIMLSIFILGFAAWRVWVYRRSKDAAQATPSASNQPPGLFDPVTDVKRTLSNDTIAIPPTAGDKVILTRERTAAEFKVNLGYEPKVIYAAFDEKEPTIGDPPNIKVTPASGLQISAPPVYVAIPPPALSPRTAASMDPRYSMMSKSTRLVFVESTFTPSLHDELAIREGEKLQLLEEYGDEWCLVQRVGSGAAERGVVPRFCVVEC